ncbi:MAG TPA: GNAT family N-acetyltransferase [Acidimicrobiales bacterium]|nr:GNAT family N-acetyltransferase [Acidimicrobiales bacterium]
MAVVLDELMAHAWPPATEQVVGGWRCRWAWGLTRRANFVLTIGAPADLEGCIGLAEAFYAGRELPVRFQVSSASSPRGLDAALCARGYREEAPTRMCVADAAALAATGERGSWRVEAHARPSDEWFTVHLDAERRGTPDDTTRRRYLETLLAPKPRAVFVEASVDGTVAAVGQGVLEAGWLGVQCMATLAAYRRRGGASVVLRSLAVWAAERGATGLYLAVAEENAAARRLYAGAGFTSAHGYSYWTLG